MPVFTSCTYRHLLPVAGGSGHAARSLSETGESVCASTLGLCRQKNQPPDKLWMRVMEGIRRRRAGGGGDRRRRSDVIVLSSVLLKQLERREGER